MTRLRFVAVIAVLVSISAVYVLVRPAAPQKETSRAFPTVVAPSSTSEPATADTADTANAPRQLKRGRLKVPKGQPIPEVFPHQAERQSIQQLADTYDVKNIPAIAVYLNHTDDTVRTAARMALVQIGDASAASYLESALQQNHGEEETEAIKEAISFLKLPTMPIPAPADAPKAP